jgi:toxin ParE1/3/4
VSVHWTHAAQQHLRCIFEYIARDAPLYARKTVDRLTRRSMQLEEFPWSGRIVREFDAPDVRELIEYPCRIICRIRLEQIDVLAVVHCARMLPPEL